MKKLILGALLLPLFCTSQTLKDKDNGVTANVSFGAGYMNHHTKQMGKFSVGGMYEGNHLNLGLEMFFTNLNSYPVIPSLTYGVASKSWEVYGGISYHMYSYDIFPKKNDYYPIFGIVHKFINTPYTIDASFTNQIYSLKLGVGGIL